MPGIPPFETAAFSPAFKRCPKQAYLTLLRGLRFPVSKMQPKSFPEAACSFSRNFKFGAGQVCALRNAGLPAAASKNCWRSMPCKKEKYFADEQCLEISCASYGCFATTSLRRPPAALDAAQIQSVRFAWRKFIPRQWRCMFSGIRFFPFPRKEIGPYSRKNFSTGLSAYTHR